MHSTATTRVAFLWHKYELLFKTQQCLLSVLRVKNTNTLNQFISSLVSLLLQISVFMSMQQSCPYFLRKVQRTCSLNCHISCFQNLTMPFSSLLCKYIVFFSNLLYNKAEYFLNDFVMKFFYFKSFHKNSTAHSLWKHCPCWFFLKGAFVFISEFVSFLNTGWDAHFLLEYILLSGLNFQGETSPWTGDNTQY